MIIIIFMIFYDDTIWLDKLFVIVLGHGSPEIGVVILQAFPHNHLSTVYHSVIHYSCWLFCVGSVWRNAGIHGLVSQLLALRWWRDRHLDASEILDYLRPQTPSTASPEDSWTFRDCMYSIVEQVQMSDVTGNLMFFDDHDSGAWDRYTDTSKVPRCLFARLFQISYLLSVLYSILVFSQDATDTSGLEACSQLSQKMRSTCPAMFWCFTWEQLSWPSIDEVDSTDGAEVQETESNEVQENGGHSSTVWIASGSISASSSNYHWCPGAGATRTNKASKVAKRNRFEGNSTAGFFDVFCTWMWACLQSCEARYQWGVHVLLSKWWSMMRAYVPQVLLMLIRVHCFFALADVNRVWRRQECVHWRHIPPGCCGKPQLVGPDA